MSLNTPISAAMFAHQPLNRDDDAIRLVELQPGRKCDPVQLKLFNSAISRAPRFSAVSYVWGPEPDTQTITIDGHLKKIRYNLWNCLRHLQSYQPQEKLASIPLRYEKQESRLRRLFSRRKRNQAKSEVKTPNNNTEDQRDSPVLLWIDQLCIDQQKSHERNHQVQLMAAIYSAAANVISWIPSTELNERRVGKQLLAEGLNIVRRNLCHVEDPPWSVSMLNNDTVHESRMKRFMLDHEQVLAKESFLFHNKDEHIEEVDSVVNDILCSEYWSRLWIRQEVLANPNTWIMYGNFAISLRDFAKFTCVLRIPKINWDRDLWNRGRANGLDYSEAWHSFYRSNLKNSKKTLNDDEKFDVFTILEAIAISQTCEMPQDDVATAIERWASGKCSDVRDKVYGLRSLIKQGHKLYVHYELPAESVLRQVLALHCTGEGSRKDFGPTLILLMQLGGLLEVELEKFRTLAIEPDASIEVTPTLSRSLAQTKSSYLLKLLIRDRSKWRETFGVGHIAYWGSEFRGDEANFLPRTDQPAFHDTDTVWHLDLGIGTLWIVFQQIRPTSDSRRMLIHLKAWGRKDRNWGHCHFYPAPTCFKAFLTPHQRMIEYHGGQVELQWDEQGWILVRLDYDALWFVVKLVLAAKIVVDEKFRILPV